MHWKSERGVGIELCEIENEAFQEEEAACGGQEYGIFEKSEQQTNGWTWRLSDRVKDVKEENKHSMLTHIYGIQENGTDEPICRAGTEREQTCGHGMEGDSGTN